MILNKLEIHQLVRGKRIGISPFDEKLLKDASYTFTLGEHIEVPIISKGSIDVDEMRYSRYPLSEEGFVINPGSCFKAYTREKLTLHGNFGCFLSVRSSVATAGLAALLTDTFCEPNTDNTIALPLYNASQTKLRLRAGMKIVKGVFIPMSHELGHHLRG